VITRRKRIAATAALTPRNVPRFSLDSSSTRAALSSSVNSLINCCVATAHPSSSSGNEWRHQYTLLRLGQAGQDAVESSISN
jgi:hypothetical protein